MGTAAAPAPPSGPGPALAFLFYAVAAVVGTWPLASAPARLGVPNPDAYGNSWVLAWVVHQAIRDPVHLFDANIYHPHATSLAFNESLLPEAIQAAPLLALGASPLLAHNLVLLLTLPLSAPAAYLLARGLSGSAQGAFLAGLGYGFGAYRFHHINHVHSLSVQWLPLALLFAQRVARSNRFRDAVGLAGSALLQALSCAYFGFLLVPTLGLALWQGLPEVRGRRLWKPALALAVAGGIALLVFLPHRAVRERYGFT